MQNEQTMTIGDGIIGAVASGLVGWFVASVTKVGRSEYKELIQRVDAIEKDSTGKMTRAEFEQAFSKVESLVREFRAETRTEFRELKSELKAKV